MNVCVSHFVWLKCDGFRCFADNITRVSRPTGSAPALSEPDFGVLLGHIMSFGICGILLDSKYLSQFCLVIYFGFLTALLVLYHYDNYLTTISVSAQPIHQMNFWILHV